MMRDRRGKRSHRPLQQPRASPDRVSMQSLEASVDLALAALDDSAVLSGADTPSPRHTATWRWERPPVSPGDHAAAAAQRSLSALRGRWPRGGRARCWSTRATLVDVLRGCVATGRGRLGGPVQPLPTRGAAQIDITPSRALRERAVRPSEVVRACAPSRRIGAHTQHPPMQRRPSQAGPGAPRVSRDSSTMRTSRHLVGQHGSEPTCSDGSRVWRGLSEARGQRVQVERRDACGFMQRPGG